MATASAETAAVTKKARRAPMRSLAVCSGKGGVGKSNLAVNLALELGQLDERVTLLDADFGLANADLICGVVPMFHLGHVIKGERTIYDITIPLSRSVNLIPGGTGVTELANYSLEPNSDLFIGLETLSETTDFMIIDTAAGIADNVVGVLSAAAEVIVVATPDPTSIVDAYATIKVLLRNSPGKPISVVVNCVSGAGEAEQVYRQINAAVRSFLAHDVRFLGMVPHDPRLQDAVREQIPITQFAPESAASRAIRLIARQLHKQSAGDADDDVRPVSFWTMLAGS